MIALGLAIIFGGVMLEIAWLIFCFGSVVIGVALLFLAPAVLIAPFVISSAIGGGFITKKYEAIERS